MLAAPLAGRFGLGRAFQGAMWLIVLSLALAALTANFTLLLMLRLAAGVAGAVCFITGAALAAHAANADGDRAGLVLGIYFSGVGLGIFITGISLPALLEYGAHTWHLAWLAMGGVA